MKKKLSLTTMIAMTMMTGSVFANGDLFVNPVGKSIKLDLETANRVEVVKQKCKTKTNVNHSYDCYALKFVGVDIVNVSNESEMLQSKNITTRPLVQNWGGFMDDLNGKMYKECVDNIAAGLNRKIQNKSDVTLKKEKVELPNLRIVQQAGDDNFTVDMKPLAQVSFGESKFDLFKTVGQRITYSSEKRSGKVEDRKFKCSLKATEAKLYREGDNPSGVAAVSNATKNAADKTGEFIGDGIDASRNFFGGGLRKLGNWISSDTQ
jgi:hypothetical protein